MKKNTIIYTIICLIVSSAAQSGELDGKALICNLNGAKYNKTIFSFDGDAVEEVHLNYKNVHDDEYNFDYQSITTETKKNIFSASASQLFWCDVGNVMTMGSPGSACQAQNLEDLMLKAMSSTLPAGTWTVIDRSSLEIKIGAIVMTNAMDVASGKCIVADAEGTKSYLDEQEKIIESSKDDYDKKLDEAKKLLEKKKI